MPERLLLLALFATERHILQKKFSQTALVAVVTTAGNGKEGRKRKEESDYSYHSITLYLRYSFLIHILSLNLQRSFSI